MPTTSWIDQELPEDFAEGDGSQANPFKISSALDLALLSYKVKNGEGRTSFTCFSQTYFIQTQDIDLGEHLWSPIGISGKYFCGKYDGQGYKISNIMINSNEGYQGLFGYARGSNATMKDINMVGGIIKSTKNYIGSIVGYARYSTISNCTSNVIVQGVESVGGIAGFCGAIWDIDSAVTIENCKFTGSVTATKGYAGGIAGAYYGPNMINCFNYGNVAGGQNVGGLAGKEMGSDTVIQNSANFGQVEGQTNVGGLVGNAEGSATIKNCFSKCELNVLEPSGAAGGLVGLVSTTNKVEFSSCFFSGTSNLPQLGLFGGERVPTLTACYVQCNGKGIYSNYADWAQFWGVAENLNDGLPLPKGFFWIACGAATTHGDIIALFDRLEFDCYEIETT